ncbi:MAG TPA: LPS export ABC transporter periplasmic protein LptC [Burkholderiaceae bacterium]|nr:LPS export ABC transporter periplasmic protein LptC [Burkholderiaceae bacterium]
MRDRITAIIAVLLLALLAATTYWYSQSTRIGGLSNPVSREEPDVVVDGATLTQFDAQGRATNKLIGDRVMHYPSDDRVEVIRPRMISLRADQPQLDARANHARVEDGGARVVLTGDVTVIRAAGKDGEPPMRLSTERLVALPDVEQFSTDAPAEIERGGSRINSVGMDYDNIKRTVKFRSKVRGTVEANPKAKGVESR